MNDLSRKIHIDWRCRYSLYKSSILTSIFLYTLLQKNLDDAEIIEKLKQENVEDSDEYEGIRCPHCKWQPNARSLWFCVNCDHPEYFYKACGTSWNTFDTEGVCPGCSHQWRWTSCLKCSHWSPHKDWYVKEAEV